MRDFVGYVFLFVLMVVCSIIYELIIVSWMWGFMELGVEVEIGFF